jgi:hypothetical protein
LSWPSIISSLGFIAIALLPSDFGGQPNSWLRAVPLPDC